MWAAERRQRKKSEESRCEREREHDCNQICTWWWKESVELILCSQWKDQNAVTMEKSSNLRTDKVFWLLPPSFAILAFFLYAPVCKTKIVTQNNMHKHFRLWKLHYESKTYAIHTFAFHKLWLQKTEIKSKSRNLQFALVFVLVHRTNFIIKSTPNMQTRTSKWWERKFFEGVEKVLDHFAELLMIEKCNRKQLRRWQNISNYFSFSRYKLSNSTTNMKRLWVW